MISTNKTGLIIIAHGSRINQTQTELNKLVLEVQNKLPQFHSVCIAYLELSSPTIEEAFYLLLKQGLHEIYFLPYLLAAGRHLNSDIPEEIQKLAELNPGVRLIQIPHIGAATGIPHLISEHVLINQKQP